MLFKQIFIAATAILSASTIFAAGHFDDKVRADFFAGIAGDPAALQHGMAAAKDAICQRSALRGRGEIMARNRAACAFSRKFNQGNILAGTEFVDESQ
jgi:hypothetical protein